jgi:hypothetical protein
VGEMSKLKIVVINGFPGSGKDSFVNLLLDSVTLAKCDILNLHTSDPAKEAAKLLGWKGEKSPEARDFLAELMEQSNLLFDTSFKYIKSKIEFRNCLRGSLQNLVVFVHSREPENIKRYVDELGASTLLIKRKLTEEEICLTTNRSDSCVLGYDYDKIVYNDGDLHDLHAKAKKYLEELLND